MSMSHVIPNTTWRSTPDARSRTTTERRLSEQDELDAVVGREHERPAETTEKLRNQALVHARSALVLAHLDEAVDGGLVEALLRRLVRVKHHAPADRVERVVERRSDGARNGRADESRHNADHALVCLVRVHVLDLREEAELPTTVHEGPSDRDGRPTVETRNTTSLHGLHDAVRNSVELSF